MYPVGSQVFELNGVPAGGVRWPVEFVYVSANVEWEVGRRRNAIVELRAEIVEHKKIMEEQKKVQDPTVQKQSKAKARRKRKKVLEAAAVRGPTNSQEGM